MPARTTQSCPHRGEVEDLAHDRPSTVQRGAVHAHLERCEACRGLFRRITAGWLPHIRNYTILEQLGKGGFGVVYKAVHHQKQRIEALKVHFGRTPVRAAYFENEVRLIARLRHPNIATLYEANLGGTPAHYSMEFVEGRQLDEFFRAAHTPLPQRIRLLRTIAEAIGYAHAEGIVHRDIKPQNILIDAAGQPHLLDFGIAKRLGLDEDEPAMTGPDDMRRREGAIGTFGYIAPEQAAGGSVDARADIYALGALLYHCVTGDPARFANRADRLSAVLRERRISRADDLAAIIARCVHTDADRRYQSCAEFVADLDSFLAAGPIRARENRPPGYRLIRSLAYVLHKHPFAIRGVIMAGIALFLAQIFWLTRTDFAPPAPVVAAPAALIAFTPQTLDALRSGALTTGLPQVQAENRKSWRALHGRLLEKLAAARPRVVVWDYFFPDCQPEYDEFFLRGVAACPAPVIVGCREFDANGDPRMCPAIHDAVAGVGAVIGVKPYFRSAGYIVPLCVVRGFGEPLPGLAAVGFAAYQFPDATPQFVVQPTEVEVRYRKRRPASGELHWYARTDRLPVADVDTSTHSAILQTGDSVILANAAREARAAWPARTIGYEQVLAADAEQLRAWFADRAVVVGQMLPGEDQHPDADGRPIFGCQVQAAMLDTLLNAALETQITRPGVALRCLVGAIAGGLAAMLLARLLRWRRSPLPWLAAAGSLAAGVGIAVRVGIYVESRGWVEVGMLGSAALAAGGVCLLIELIRRRQMELAPTPAWSSEESTLTSTVLAPTE